MKESLLAASASPSRPVNYDSSIVVRAPIAKSESILSSFSGRRLAVVLSDAVAPYVHVMGVMRGPPGAKQSPPPSPAPPRPVDREVWDKKIDFLLSVIGFAVDLGNIWRFPNICYRNGGGAYLIPYIIMLIFGGLPLFYMELALGQFQRCGCITVWKRICPMFKGIGFGIFFIASYVAIYYNTIMAWSLYYVFASMRPQVPWSTCGNQWNTPACSTLQALSRAQRANFTDSDTLANTDLHFDNSSCLPDVLTNTSCVSAAAEFFERRVLESNKSTGIHDVGAIKWEIALCLCAIFVVVYFSMWRGIKSSGKAVWVTATAPYIILVILLIRGLTLPGAIDGVMYFITPKWEKLLVPQVWIDAAAQVFFSLGPGFGVLLALSSYNKFNNNCYFDAMLTASINSCTCFLGGFVVFSILGYMAKTLDKPIDSVATEGAGLVFIVYPEAISTLYGSTFWAIIFFIMLITLGLDSTFGGLEAVITALCDEWPALGRHRKMFVAVFIGYCFLGALSTTTYGGNYIVTLLDAHGASISILLICFLEAVAVNWFYGVDRFSRDVHTMLGFTPGLFWRICWRYISPAFLLILFICSIVFYQPLVLNQTYAYPVWSLVIGWMITGSSVICIPAYIVYRYFTLSGSFRHRLRLMTSPEEAPKHVEMEETSKLAAYL